MRRFLLSAHRYSGAIYLAGYAIECLLKWAVTWRKAHLYLPAQLETHDWDKLLIEAGLSRSLRSQQLMSALYSELAESWGPELRYLAKTPGSAEAQELYHKLVVLYDWIAEQTI